MKKVVTTNYRDRSSPYRWLIRNLGAALGTAQAFKSVIAKGVTFTTSSASESGFGCSVVAECDTAEGTDPEPVILALKFQTDRFVDPTGKMVPACDILTLDENGGMLATIH